MPRQDLYPPIEPFETAILDVGDGHRLYYEQSGNPSGQPVLFLHGGPGAGSSPDHRRFFDPAHYRIVIHDQRGAGRSTPLGELRANSTGHLIADIERLRETLGIAAWLVFGGSWGSTLALAYAEEHPAAVKALILRGIFLGRPAEIEWFLHGMGTFFPESRERFLAALPDAERDDPLGNFHRRLNDADPAVHLPAARAWSMFEGGCSTLRPSPETVAAFGEDRMALGLARIEAHYFINGIFLPDNALLDRIDRIRHIPGTIVQGRYDVICPIITADRLRRAWPDADYVVVPDAGHSAMEPGVRKALVQAMEGYKTLSW